MARDPSVYASLAVINRWQESNGGWPYTRWLLGEFDFEDLDLVARDRILSRKVKAVDTPEAPEDTPLPQKPTRKRGRPKHSKDSVPRKCKSRTVSWRYTGSVGPKRGLQFARVGDRIWHEGFEACTLDATGDQFQVLINKNGHEYTARVDKNDCYTINAGGTSAGDIDLEDVDEPAPAPRRPEGPRAASALAESSHWMHVRKHWHCRFTARPPPRILSTSEPPVVTAHPPLVGESGAS